MTEWKRKSKVEIVPGSKRAMGGPDPRLKDCDEVELIDEETWEEARKIGVKRNPDLPYLRPDIDT